VESGTVSIFSAAFAEAGNWQPVEIISAAAIMPAHLVRIETPLIFIDVWIK